MWVNLGNPCPTLTVFVQYKKLEPLQGHVIPIYYGEARCEGMRAQIISEVPGINAIEQERPRIGYDEFERRLRAANREVAKFGVVVDDFNTGNLILIDDRIMYVDLEKWYEPEPEVVDKLNGFGIDESCDRYADYLNCMDEDELV